MLMIGFERLVSGDDRLMVFFDLCFDFFDEWMGVAILYIFFLCFRFITHFFFNNNLNTL